MTENKGDLISREALKKAIDTYDKFACLPDGKLYPFRELKHPQMFISYIHFEDVIKAIDNAPTVEPKTKLVANVTFDKEQMEELVEKAKADILAQIERPQGEWIFRSGVTCGGYYKCNKCGEVERAEKNYCPNCGALMMKGGKEE